MELTEGLKETDPMVYEFEMPQAIVGRLIGKFGNFVQKIKANTGANIIVKKHPGNLYMKICAVEGLNSEIEDALDMIRERFPESAFPSLSLARVNDGSQAPASPISFLPSSNKLGLIEGVINDVTISSVLTLDHIFVQQPTHPTYPALSRMHKILTNVYEQPGVPELLKPFSPGVICVTRIKEKEWVRAEVVAIQEDKDEVTVRLVDVGGYLQVPIDDLRQIRVDFVTIPFQATECRLANLVPIDESLGWSAEALTYFKYITMGQILQAYVVGYSPGDSTALIHLYRLNADQSYSLINEEMATNEYARWVEETEMHAVPPPYETESGEEWTCDGTDMQNDYLLMRASASSSEGHDHSSVDGNDPLFLDGMDNLSLECIDSASIGSSDQASPSGSSSGRHRKASSSNGNTDSFSTLSDEAGDH